MAKLTLNVGSANNDKTGDTLRAGGLKIKANFDDIYAALASDGVNISGGNVLKTGNYQDLSNKPVFATVATTGDFYDLTDRPDIGIFVGEPPNALGVDGHVSGNLAFGANNLYVCREDYVQQDQFTNFVFMHEDTEVNFSLQARFNNTTNVIALKPGNVTAGTDYTPAVDWTVSNGTLTRTITMVSEEVDIDGDPYYLCTLDGAFTSVENVYYEMGYPMPSGTYVFSAQWKPEYQDLVDAHVLGQGSKLYVTYDGYGRVINHVVHDSIDNEITISYQSGSKIADYAGIIIKLDQPEIWKSIPFAPVYGDPFPGMGGSTGDITFNGVKIIGDGTASGDGAGFSTIELVPDNDLYNITPTGDFGIGGQYLVIDPTAPNHIHIRAGGPQDEAAAQLILGGEKANVTVRDQDNSFTEKHEVLINTQSNDGSAINLWQFKGNADLELPINGGIVFDRADTTIRVGMGFHIASGEGISLDAIDLTDPESPAYNSWYFSPIGSTYFPTLTVPINDNANPSGTGQTLKFGDASQQAIIYGPESTSSNISAERIIIQGAPGYEGTSGEGGDVYVWAGPGGDADGNGGDIKVRAGRGDGSGAGGYLNFQAGDSSTGNGGYINIESGQSTYGLGGDITIWAHDGGDIKLRTHNNITNQEWLFGANGSVTFPDSTVQETAWAGGRVVTVPTHSTGASGDLEGDLAFSNGYIYYCTADYGQVGHQVSVATAYNGATALNTNSFQLTKSADTLQIAVGDIISDSDGGATSIVDSVSSDDNYTYVGTGSMAYQAVFPLTFTSTDYVSGGNIWKRVAWSNDTW
jgi:hypothetical protein